MATGAVTFLDVLGWKGIWLRRSHREVVGLLDALVQTAERIANEQRGKVTAGDIRVLSISDTIVLLSEGDVASVVPSHGLICKTLLADSVRAGIPLRGATSHGQYYASEGSTLIGPAVDEAASWHEALDWIGVALTPGAEYKHSPGAPWYKYPRAPVKGLGARSLWCVDWSDVWVNEDEIKVLFGEAGPIDVGIAPKYMNTIDFLSDRIRARPQQPPA